LLIKKVVAGNGTELKFTLGSPVPAFGQSLTIDNIPQLGDKKLKISIQYETTDKCTALQWLLKEQTAEKKHPFMFSQCQVL